MLKESMEYSQNSQRENRKITTCNLLDLETLGFDVLSSKISLDTTIKFMISVG